MPMLFRVEGAVGNGDGVFDASYDFGEGGAMTGTPEEVGEAVARYLASLTPEDCRTMRYGTPKFFVQLVISPEESTAP